MVRLVEAVARVVTDEVVVKMLADVVVAYVVGMRFLVSNVVGGGGEVCVKGGGGEGGRGCGGDDVSDRCS